MKGLSMSMIRSAGRRVARSLNRAAEKHPRLSNAVGQAALALAQAPIVGPLVDKVISDSHRRPRNIPFLASALSNSGGISPDRLRRMQAQTADEFVARQIQRPADGRTILAEFIRRAQIASEQGSSKPEKILARSVRANIYLTRQGSTRLAAMDAVQLEEFLAEEVLDATIINRALVAKVLSRPQLSEERTVNLLDAMLDTYGVDFYIETIAMMEAMEVENGLPH
ncbi:hypothetical protein ACFL31_03820 [Candidatus Margulisiibacteriota bacterium]